MKIQNRKRLTTCNQILNDILDEIRIKSKNVFIFAKAFPLVRVDTDKKLKIVGTLTRYSNDFRQKLKDGITACNKVINVKFDLLNLELLDYIRDKGCRVLHLSSDVYRSDSLCIEDKNGIVKYLGIEELKRALLSQTSKQSLNIDVVVLAMPNSE